MCPVGVADGCCSRLTNGGTDPDCPSFRCHLGLDTPILLSDLTPAEKSGTAVVWTGRELATARLDYRPVQTNPGAQFRDYDVLFERRDENGDVLGTPVRYPDLGASYAPTGPGSLAFEPTSRSLLYSFQASERSYVYNLDEVGQKRWQGYGLVSCTDRVARVQSFAASGRFVFGGDNYTCDLPGDRHAEIHGYNSDGSKLASMPNIRKELASSSYDGVYACNGDCSQVFVYYTANSAQPFGRLYDIDDDVLGTPQAAAGSLYGGVNGTAAAFDGTRYFVLSNDYTSAGVSRARFRFFDPSTNSFGGYTFEESINREGFTGSMIWTGSGFVAAMALHPFATGGLLPPRNTSRIRIWHLAPEGTIREIFDLEAHNGLFPTMSLMPGKIAITWVRTSTTAVDQRYISFLRCQ
jgi:hypothetical protein